MQKNLKKILSAVLTIVMLLSLCAPAFPVSAAEELTTIKKWNLILGDEIAANFYVNVSDAVSDSAVMHVTDGYGTHQYALTAAKKDDNGNYIFTARLAAAQMADTISLQLHDGDNVGTAHAYTAVDYAKLILNGNYGESTKALVKAMLNYGAAAQNYFDYNVENLANQGYEATEDVEIPAVDVTNMVTGEVEGISFYGASLVFESKVAVRFYFTVTGDINSYTFSTGNDPVLKNGMYYIEVADINPQNYANAISLTVNDTLTVKYSPLTYISRMASSTSEDLVDLVKAMYAYHLAAVNYAPDAEGSIELVTVTFADVQLVKTHLGSIVNGPKALRDHLNYAKSINADVLFMPGDIVNNANQDYYDRFWTIFKSAYGEDEAQWPEFVWTMGNHEWYDMNEKDAQDAIALFKANANIESPNLVKMSQVPSTANPGQTVANYYKVIKGVPFVVISGDSRANTVSEAQKTELIGWLDEINELPSVKAGTPIYVAYHIPIADVTYFGQGASEVSKTVDEILKNYPNTIVFTGDTHCPGINERTINQIDYTSINLGSSSYSRMVNRSATSQPGEKYYNVGGGTAKDVVTGEVAFGFEYTQNLMVLQNNTDGSVVMDRYMTNTNLVDVRKVGITWNFPSGLTKDKFIYTYDRFQNKEWANTLYGKDGLTFPENASVSFSVDGTEMIVYFDDVTDHNFAEHYKITVTADGTTSKVYDVVGNYYKYYAEAQTYHFPLSDIPVGTSYAVEVKAYDFFDNESLNSLVATTESATSLFPHEVESAIAGTYTDISTKINYEVTAGGVSSLECYYKGDYLFTSGAMLGTVLSSTNLDLAEAFTVTDWSHGILTVKVKNVGDADINIGLTVVLNENGKEKWVTDFGAAHRYLVKADGEWTELSWDLNELFGIDSLDDVNGIRLKANSTSPSADGYAMHFYLDDIDILQGEHIETDEPGNVIAGGALQAGTDLTISLDNEQDISKLTFEYKIENDGHFNLALMKDWSNFYSYYEFNANGAAGNYAGVTTQVLEDGYIRVTITVSNLDKVTGNPAGVIEFLYIRGNWSDAVGYIDNIQYVLVGDEPEVPGGVFAGGAFQANTDLTISLDNDQTVTKMTFDYKINSGEYFHIALMPDWSSYYGYFKFNADGIGGNYAGITTQKLNDGSIRVYVDVPALTAKVGTPSDVLTMLYIRGGWTTANGDITNICINSAATTPPRGEAFTAGVDLTINPSVTGEFTTISFDYKIESGEYFNIALLPNWSSFYGYFQLDAEGTGIYNGVSYEKLADGYIRVTFDMAKLTKVSGTPTAAIDFLFIRGNWTNASGYIDNVQFS